MIKPTIITNTTNVNNAAEANIDFVNFCMSFDFIKIPLLMRIYFEYKWK